jgi:DNA-binding response OmpR family regulator
MPIKLKKQTVLVVEDESTLSRVIAAKMKKMGFLTLTARSVKQVDGYLDDGVKIDAIWLDHYLLGQENGLDLVTKIKVPDSPWKNVLIFVVSNTASNDKVKSYLSLGINRYFVKAENRLDDIIAELCNKLSKNK